MNLSNSNSGMGVKYCEIFQYSCWCCSPYIFKAMFLASASNNFKCHDFSNGKIIHNYQPTTKVEGPIRSISWSRDGNWMALVPWYGMTEILNVRDNLKILKTVPDVEEPSCAKFPNTTKKNICLGTKNGLVLVYDIKTRNITKQFERHSSKITHLEYTLKDTNIVAGCESGEVFIFSNVTNSPPSILKVPRSRTITSLKTSIVKRHLVLGGSNEGVVVLWDINVNKPKFVVDAHVGAVNAVAFSPTHSDLVVSAGSDRQFSFFDVAENKCITNITVENNMTAVDFSADGLSFVMANQKGHIHIYDTRSIQTPVHSFEAHNKTIRHVAFQKSSESGERGNRSSLSSNCFTPVDTKPDVKKSRNSDLFGILAPTADSPCDGKQSIISPEDSFLAALGMNRSSTAGSSCQEDEVFTKEDIKLPTILCSSADEADKTCDKQMSIPEKLSSLKMKAYSSTPILSNQPSQQSVFGFSPDVINNNKETQDTMPVSWEAKLNALKEELCSVLAETRNNIEFQVMQSAFGLRSMILGVRMLIARESIQTEDHFNQSSDIINDLVNSPETNMLRHENESLRLRIRFLEEQLQNFASRKEDDKSS